MTSDGGSGQKRQTGRERAAEVRRQQARPRAARSSWASAARSPWWSCSPC
ncbi:hypothetical protein ACFQ9X_16080 [Catenulispora yoronensis]